MQGNPGTYHQTKNQIEQETVLIARAKQDPGQFSVLYEKYHRNIFLFILKRVESEETASDITSQVFLKALTNLGKYKDMGFPFSSWLFRIARNEIYDLYQKNKVNMVVSIESKGILSMISEMGSGEKQDHQFLYLALEKLEEHEMELIELRFFENRPFKEIGEILDITENNAKVRTYRTLDKLKQFLSHER